MALLAVGIILDVGLSLNSKNKSREKRNIGHLYPPAKFGSPLTKGAHWTLFSVEAYIKVIVKYWNFLVSSYFRLKASETFAIFSNLLDSKTFDICVVEESST